MAEFRSRADNSSLHVLGSSPSIEYNLRAKSALQDLPFPHREKVQSAIRDLGRTDQPLREIDEEGSIWLLEAPPRYYVYLRIHGNHVTVLDVMPQSRLREMGFASQSESSSSSRWTEE